MITAYHQCTLFNSKKTDAMRNNLVQRILAHAENTAIDAESVVIIGEYGSGKTWLAQRIHELSDRNDKPFHLIDCHTLSDENEAKENIFGYLSFTENGVKINKGFLEKCNGGTLFLKGFDSFSKKLQLQILKSVKGNESKHIGGQSSIPIDVHIIISIDTNLFYQSKYRYKLLQSELGNYHEAIFYPPLRHRRDEISYLINYFLKDDFARRYSFASKEISIRALYQCICYDWPGNVQQLKNAIEHAAIISAGNSIQPEHLPLSVKSGQPNEDDLLLLERDLSFRAAEKKLIEEVIHNVDSLKNSARLLGLTLKAFDKKLNMYGLLDEYSGQ
ncbi:MAG: sigma-54-dependent Fis family transcriptional regulator [Gracilimonas sp.]|uniref:sigma-54-dependent transcriptional regulator n=1 Tax=Gracilimonas sp. TaxID=1974203 RepID=UPI0019B8BE78|nr:sigma 54-interacting transcriptional regulator [Gracilimonas sp.]MBD3615419.1 sigma-54-dependent Fis family transcriptional regulator [Gracilimonas sp.]